MEVGKIETSANIVTATVSKSAEAKVIEKFTQEKIQIGKRYVILKLKSKKIALASEG